MSTIVACFTNNGVPLTSPANAPTIRIRRTDTQALVVTDDAMTEQGDGCFSYDFTPTDGLDYSIRADGDPTASGQTTQAERYAFGSLSGGTEARIGTDIPAILVDTGTDIPAAIAALNDLSIADVQTALTNQGYTAARATNLDNLDAAITAVLAAISSLNDLSIADVQTAMDNQGYTAARAALLDDLVQILASVEIIRKVTSNRVVVNLTDTQVDVYEDNGTTIAFSFSISSDRRERDPI